MGEREGVMGERENAGRRGGRGKKLISTQTAFEFVFDATQLQRGHRGLDQPPHRLAVIRLVLL